MILNEKVSIKLTKKSIDRYKDLGKVGDVVEISPSELFRNSTKLIDVKCDVCRKERKLEYRLYMKNYNKKVVEVFNNNLIRDFLNTNHIDGYVRSSIKIGLFYEKTLVSLMIFQKYKNEQYKLIRFCNEKYTDIDGSYEKILKYFFQKIINENILLYTFSDNAFFYNDLLKIGFEIFDKNIINYYWIINNIRVNKLNNKMKNNSNGKIFKLWSCENKKWIYRKKMKINEK